MAHTTTTMTTEDPRELIASLGASNMFNLAGLVAVITGGASGIGLMFATTLLANGAKVYILDRDASAIEEVLRTYGEVLGGRLVGVQGDVSKKEEAKRLAAFIGETEEYVTVLFNNAGVVTKTVGDPAGSQDVADFTKAFDVYDESDFQEIFAVNTFGPYFMSVAFLPLLDAAKTKGGNTFPAQIINTSSANAFSKDINTSSRTLPYHISKSAIAHLTKLLASEFVPLKIRVNGIAPGLFHTSMTSSSPKNKLGFPLPPPANCYRDGPDPTCGPLKIPSAKKGGVEDMGPLVLMLVTNEFINGEIILIDGGSLLRYPATM